MKYDFSCFKNQVEFNRQGKNNEELHKISLSDGERYDIIFRIISSGRFLLSIL
jgi:hypothetical protein